MVYQDQLRPLIIPAIAPPGEGWSWPQRGAKSNQRGTWSPLRFHPQVGQGRMLWWQTCELACPKARCMPYHQLLSVSLVEALRTCAASRIVEKRPRWLRGREPSCKRCSIAAAYGCSIFVLSVGAWESQPLFARLQAGGLQATVEEGRALVTPVHSAHCQPNPASPSICCRQRPRSSERGIPGVAQRLGGAFRAG